MAEATGLLGSGSFKPSAGDYLTSFLQGYAGHDNASYIAQRKEDMQQSVMRESYLALQELDSGDKEKARERIGVISMSLAKQGLDNSNFLALGEQIVTDPKAARQMIVDAGKATASSGGLDLNKNPMWKSVLVGKPEKDLTFKPVMTEEGVEYAVRSYTDADGITRTVARDGTDLTGAKLYGINSEFYKKRAALKDDTLKPLSPGGKILTDLGYTVGTEDFRTELQKMEDAKGLTGKGATDLTFKPVMDDDGIPYEVRSYIDEDGKTQTVARDGTMLTGRKLHGPSSEFFLKRIKLMEDDLSPEDGLTRTKLEAYQIGNAKTGTAVQVQPLAAMGDEGETRFVVGDKTMTASEFKKYKVDNDMMNTESNAYKAAFEKEKTKIELGATLTKENRSSYRTYVDKNLASIGEVEQYANIITAIASGDISSGGGLTPMVEREVKKYLGIRNPSQAQYESGVLEMGAIWAKKALDGQFGDAIFKEMIKVQPNPDMGMPGVQINTLDKIRDIKRVLQATLDRAEALKDTVAINDTKRAIKKVEANIAQLEGFAEGGPDQKPERF